jgi:hypothetical protein
VFQNYFSSRTHMRSISVSSITEISSSHWRKSITNMSRSVTVFVYFGQYWSVILIILAEPVWWSSCILLVFCISVRLCNHI